MCVCVCVWGMTVSWISAYKGPIVLLKILTV